MAYAERWALLPRRRAQKLVSFLTDPTWRAYITCYVEGLPLCRRFVGGDPARFERLLTDQLTPDQLTPAAPAIADPVADLSTSASGTESGAMTTTFPLPER